MDDTLLRSIQSSNVNGDSLLFRRKIMINDQNDMVVEELSNGIMRLILNDEKRRNALSESMLDILYSKIAASAENSEIRVVIISANGPVFCSGHDLKEITLARKNRDKGIIYFKRLFDKCSELMKLILANPKPVIAEVDGIATAAGCQLVATCDLAVASYSSKFATPGVNIGLFCSTPMVALSRNVSNKHAMEMLLTGDFVDSNRAEQIGLINCSYPSDVLSAEVNTIARKIASKSSITLAVGKKAFYKQSEMTLSDAYAYTSQIMVDNMLKKDAEEGISAFLTKRKPEWKDK